jgi:hypothetical protein
MAYKFFWLIVFSLYLSASNASTVLQIDTMQLANDAELVFEGQVVSTRAEYIPGGNIYTWIDWLVTDIVIGNVEAGSFITLRFTGGIVGDLKLDVGSDIPIMGERGIYFVEAQNGHLTNPLLGWAQGHFKILDDGSVLAGNNQRVVGITRDKGSPSGLSSGAAQGVITATQTNFATASKQLKNVKPISVDEFKSQFKGFVQ